MKNKKIKILLLSILGIVIILLISILIYKSNVLNQVYNENETTQRVLNSKLTEEEKNLYNEAVARNDNSILNGKKVKTIIEEERQRKETEQKDIEEQKTRQEEINKIEQDSTSNLLEVLYRNFNNYMNAIDTATYTFNIKDINFELIRMYYDNTVEEVNTFKTEISFIEGLEEKNADNILKLDEYIQIFDRATTTTSNIDEFFNLYDELSDKFQVCYEKLFKNVSGGKDVYEYLE